MTLPWGTSRFDQAAAHVVKAAGPATYDGFAATRGTYPSNNSGITGANVRSGHYARNSITQLKILCLNFYGPTEAATGATMSVTASVEYPAGVYTQILFSASATGTISNGGSLVSDYVTPTTPIPNAERFWIRMHLANSSGIPTQNGSITPAENVNNAFMGDCFETSATDKTMSGTISAVENVTYHPVVIAPITAPSVLILGDSISVGYGDFEPTDHTSGIGGDIGAIARTIGPSFGYSNMAMNAEAASDFITNHTKRLAVLPYCTHVIVNYAVNDLFAGASAATIESRLTTIYGYCTGKTVFQTTVPPRTNSSDVWVTTVNQSIPDAGKESARATLNSDLRSSFGPAGGVFDTGAVVETSTKWIASKTGDGVHPNQSGYLDIKASGAVNNALIGTPSAPAAETGSAWGASSSGITISTYRRTNDLVTYPGTSAFKAVRGATGLSSGLKYFEFEVMGWVQGSVILGLMDATTAAGSGMDSYVGDVPNSIGHFSSGGTGFTNTGSAFTKVDLGGDYARDCGDVFGFAVDFTNKNYYFARNNVWFLSGVPTSGATGTGKVGSWTGTPTLYPGASFFQYIGSVRIRTVSFLFAPPSGFSAWG
jgi:lysophospholipase L1-like esterase